MIRWLFALALLLLSTSLRADELRPGYLELTEKYPNRWSFVWRAPIRGGLAAPAMPEACLLSGEQRQMDAIAITVRAEMQCKDSIIGKSVGLKGMSQSFTDALVRIVPLGRPVQTQRLTAQSPMVTIAARSSRWEVAQTYTLLGFEHILEGFDHLLFVIALVLLIGGGWSIVRSVTAFTLAHSFTLAGATLGFLGLPPRPVEAVIALSILFVAVEIVKRNPERPRFSERFPWIVAFLFGLLHGFGFAGALSEIGLPEGEVPTALLTFNLGVEAGQLLVVGLTVALLVLLQRFASNLFTQFRAIAAYAIGIFSAGWLLERLLI